MSCVSKEKRDKKIRSCSWYLSAHIDKRKPYTIICFYDSKEYLTTSFDYGNINGFILSINDIAKVQMRSKTTLSSAIASL